MKHPLASLDEHFAAEHFNRMAALTQCSLAPGRAALAPSGQYKQFPSDSKDQVESRSQIDAKWLAQDKKLLEKIAILLKHQNPPVTDLQSASQGFQDFGQFVATSRLGKIAHILGPDADR